MKSRFFFLIVMVSLFIVKTELVFSQTEPLAHWQYGDSTFNYVSGLMDSLTVFLTNQEINSTNIPIDPRSIGGAWIKVEFPDLTIRDYTIGEIWGSMYCWIYCPYYGYCTGYLGSAGLTSVDTIEKRIRGWINFDADVSGDNVSAQGSFDIPYYLQTIISLPENSNNTFPNSVELYQNYPNPFNPKTTISYRLSLSSNVELSIFNMQGQNLLTLVSEKQPAGTHNIEWDASEFSSGVYLYRLSTSSGFVQTKKLILVK